MRDDGGMDDKEIDEYVVRGYITEVDAALLKGMVGRAQVVYLEKLVEGKQNSREHPWL